MNEEWDKVAEKAWAATAPAEPLWQEYIDEYWLGYEWKPGDKDYVKQQLLWAAVCHAWRVTH